MKFTVEMMRDGKAVNRSGAKAASDAEAAKACGPVKDGLGREPETGEWIRVTHQASGRTSWFKLAD